VQAVSVPEGIIFKKCSLEWHKPATNKACAAGDCQHTCPGNQIEQCPHAWTLRYSVKSRQHEQSFRDDIDPANGQVKFGSGKARARAAQLRLAHRKRAREPALAGLGGREPGGHGADETGDPFALLALLGERGVTATTLRALAGLPDAVRMAIVDTIISIDRAQRS
jgi:hypothetical protein